MKNKGVVYKAAAPVHEDTGNFPEPHTRNKPSTSNKPRIDEKTANAILAENKEKFGDPHLPYEVEIDDEFEDPEMIKAIDCGLDRINKGVRPKPWSRIKGDV